MFSDIGDAESENTAPAHDDQSAELSDDMVLQLDFDVHDATVESVPESSAVTGDNTSMIDILSPPKPCTSALVSVCATT